MDVVREVAMNHDLTPLWQPLSVGRLRLSHRLVVPPHGGGNGNLMGTVAEYEQHCAHWISKIEGGAEWIGGGPNFVANPLPVGTEPTGVGAHGPGIFRDPSYPERLGHLPIVFTLPAPTYQYRWCFSGGACLSGPRRPSQAIRTIASPMHCALTRWSGWCGNTASRRALPSTPAQML